MSGALLRWWTLVLVVMLAAGFVRLGFWQLARAEEKEVLLADFDRGADASPLELESWYPLDRYQPVRIAGAFRAQPLVGLDNQVRDGRAGVSVFQLFQPAGGGPGLVVNRGWVAQGGDRSMPPISARSDSLALEGLLAGPPQPGMRLGEVVLADVAEPQRVPWFSLEQWSNALNSPVAPQILLSTDPEPTLVQSWRPQLMPPDKHRAYAFQWFSLAAAVIIVWVVVSRKRSGKDEHERD